MLGVLKGVSGVGLLSGRLGASNDLALLAVRCSGAALLWSFHVARKLGALDTELEHFPDPFGIGHGPSLVLALAAEAVGSLLVALGLLTRPAAAGIVVTMATVLVVAALGDPEADVQSALLYGTLYFGVLVAGPGRYSIDARRDSRWRVST
jgi:putative oxidoreductase